MSPDGPGVTPSRRHLRCPEGTPIDIYLAGAGPALLLLHGWSLDHRSFVPQIEPLSRELRVITYDRRLRYLNDELRRIRPPYFRRVGGQILAQPLHQLDQGGVQGTV